LQDYAQRGFVMRFILSKGDTLKFEHLDRDIHHAMQVREHFLLYAMLKQTGTILRV
jgi:hypothetical protein